MEDFKDTLEMLRLAMEEAIARAPNSDTKDQLRNAMGAIYVAYGEQDAPADANQPGSE